MPLTTSASLNLAGSFEGRCRRSRPQSSNPFGRALAASLLLTAGVLAQEESGGAIGILGAFLKDIGGRAPAAAVKKDLAPLERTKTELVFDLTGKDLDRRLLRPTSADVKPDFSATGLRLNAKPPTESDAKVGLATPFGLGGDFEIELEFAGLEPPAGEGDITPGLGMSVRFANQGKEVAVARVTRRKQEGRCVTVDLVSGDSTRKRQPKHFPWDEPGGQIALVRTGSVLSFRRSEKGKPGLKEVYQTSCPTADAEWLLLAMNLTEGNSAGKGSLLKLTIRSERFVGLGTRMVHMDDRVIVGEPAGFEAGQLLLATEPPSRVPIAELLSIQFEPAKEPAPAAPSANPDPAAPAPKPDSPKPTDAPKADGKVAEPKAMTTTQTAKESDPKPDAKKPADAPKAGAPKVADGTMPKDAPATEANKVPTLAAAGYAGLLTLDGDDRLKGSLLGLTQESIRFKPTWGDAVELPLAPVQSIRFDAVTGENLQAAFDEALANLLPKDQVIVQNKEDKLATKIAGLVTGMADGRLLVDFEGQTRRIQLDRVAGVVLAKRPPVNRGKDPWQQAVFAGGDRLSGRMAAISKEAVDLAIGGRTVRVPLARLNSLEFRNGRMVFLSDLPPALAVEQTYLGRPLPWRKDVNLVGEPLRLKGRLHAKGLATHARSSLTWDLDGGFQRLRLTVGLDDAARQRGNVALRILADGKELHARPEFKGTDEPVKLDLKLNGARRLTLEADFGRNEDIGDRVIWADARLYR